MGRDGLEADCEIGLRQKTIQEVGGKAVKRADFRAFYRDAHGVACLSEREKMLLGLAVAMTRNCET